MAPRKTSFFQRLFGKSEHAVPESSSVLDRALSRAMTDLDEKFAEEAEPSDVKERAARAS